MLKKSIGKLSGQQKHSWYESNLADGKQVRKNGESFTPADWWIHKFSVEEAKVRFLLP